MKKSSFVAMVLGTVSLMLFALGMCMTMLPEWNAFHLGIVFGCLGLILLLITFMIWRRMEHKQPIHISMKQMITVIVGIIGAFTFGIGMCFSMVYENMIQGIIIGCIGIFLLLLLIPITKGIKE